MNKSTIKLFFFSLLITFSLCLNIPNLGRKYGEKSEISIITVEQDPLNIRAAAYTWLPTEVVTAESIYANGSDNPDMAVDSIGNAYVVWHEQANYNGSGNERDVFFKKWNIATRTWGPIEAISTVSDSFSRNPSIAIDDSQNVHIVWQDRKDYMGSGSLDYDIFYKCWNATSQSWTVTEVVSTNSTDDSVESEIAVDSLGNVHVVWEDITDYNGSGSDQDIFYSCWNATFDNWTTTEVVSTESSMDSNQSSIAIDTLGNAHVVWSDSTNYNNSGTDEDIFYKCWNATLKNWTKTEVVSTQSTSFANYPSIASDGLNNIHVVWIDDTGSDWDIYYNCWNATTYNWTGTEVISTESTSQSSYPSIVCDDLNNVHVVWHDFTDLDGFGIDYDIFYKFWNRTTDLWTTTDIVSTESDEDSLYPSIAIDDSNDISLVWQDRSDYDGAGTEYDVFYKRFIQMFPQSDNPQDITTNYTGKETINWTLSADYGGGVYRVLANDTIGSTYSWVDWTSWTNNSVNYIPINRTTPGIFNYTIYFNDSYGFWGSPDSVIVTVLDEAPTSNSPNDIVTTSMGLETIDWTLIDDYGVANYTVLANDTAGSTYTWIPWTSWDNDTTYNIPINRTFPGIFNYTILYNDSLNQFGIQDTVIVTVQNGLPISDTPLDVPTSKAGLEVITWTLWDDYGNGSYRVIANDTQGNFYVWQDWIFWTNNTPFAVQINRSLPGIFSYAIEFNDTYGLFGTPDTVIVTISDAAPQSNHPTTISTFQNADAYIPWILTDDFGSGYYRVFINGTPGSWNTWSNNSILNFKINTDALGFFNYTIQFNTSTGQIAYDTVIVEIRVSSGNGGPPGGGIIIVIVIIVGVASAVSLLAVVMVRKSRKNLREKEAEIELLHKQRDELTEDDILISKERHICLVHKGTIEGYSYICPECGSYYCVKCVEAIKKTADECWSCGASLDPEKAKAGLKKPKKIKEIDEKIEVKEDFEFDAAESEKKAPLKAPKAKKGKPGLTPPPLKPTVPEKRLTIKATPVKKHEEIFEEEFKETVSPEPQPEDLVTAEEKQLLQRAVAIKKFDDYIEQLNTMVQKLDIKFSAGTIRQEEYIEKKTMLAEKLGEAMGKRDQLKD
jgi:hypothetical protein